MLFKIAISALAGSLLAQPAPQFEVASVRPNRRTDRIVTIDVGPGTRFAAQGYTLVLLIQRAYGVMDWNVTGGPDWIREDRFDVVAKAPGAGNLTEAQLRPMLAALLADRFQLQLHRSSREAPGFALQPGNAAPVLAPSAAPEELRDSYRMDATSIRARAISLPTFARFTGGKLGTLLADETGLTGLFDVHLEWPPLPVQPAIDMPGYDRREALRDAVFTAIRRQFGLRIVEKKVAIPMLVIDHAGKPTGAEN